MPVTEPAKDLKRGMDNAGMLRDMERIMAAQRPPEWVIDPITGTANLIVGGRVICVSHPLTPNLPKHIVADARFITAESLITYAAPFIGVEFPRAKLFVNVAGPSMVVDFDYHSPVVTGAPNMGANHRAHTATWLMRTSLNWDRWVAIDGKVLPQKAFVEFLEENAVDVREPKGAELMELLAAITGTKKVSFTNGVRLASGDVQVSWVEETDAKTKGDRVMPGSFLLGLPIFFGDTDAYAVTALLRYIVNDSGLSFKIVLNRRQEIFEKAVAEQAAKVGAALGLDPLFGSVSPPPR
jgi:hypothetical protein